MFKDAIEVEANVMSSGKIKQKYETYRRKVREENQSSKSSSIAAKFDVRTRTMEILMDRLALDNRPKNRDQPEPWNINPNFRSRAPPQIKQRDQRNQRNAED